MARIIKRKEAFDCGHCGTHVDPVSSGCTRNHCPVCLWSCHVDLDKPGDRLCECEGLMKPVDVVNDKKKGEMLLHVCQKCGHVMRNRIARDDSRDAMVAVCEAKVFDQ